MVCLRSIIVNTMHRGDNKDNNHKTTIIIIMITIIIFIVVVTTFIQGTHNYIQYLKHTMFLGYIMFSCSDVTVHSTWV
jgi:hypothetical protein